MVGDPLRATRLAQSRWARARWLVLAPHADDETLGVGALIHQASRSDHLAGVAFLTDGAGSHPCAGTGEKSKLVAARKSEARAAVRVLAPSARNVMFLGWPDARPHQAGSKAFIETATRLAAFCNTHNVDAIAVTAGHEPHCDHVAAFCVAREAARRASRPTTIFEYIVWAKQRPQYGSEVVRTAAVDLGRRQRALAQHRSQLTPLFGEGFRVPVQMRTMKPFDLLYLRT